MSLISKTVDKNQQGTLQGIATSLTSFGSLVGLISGGFLYTYFNKATFLIIAAIIYIVFLYSSSLYFRKKKVN